MNKQTLTPKIPALLQPLSVAQARQLEEWNAKIEARHHDRSTKHNSKPKVKETNNANTSKSVA